MGWCRTNKRFADPTRKPIFARTLVFNALVAMSLAGCGRSPGGAPEVGPPVVHVQRPEVRDVTEYHFYTGTTAPVERVEIRARVAGELMEMRYTPSSVVEPDQPLFLIEPSVYEAAVASAEAEVDRAKASAEAARITQQRVASAFARSAATEEEKLEADATLSQREAEQRIAEAALADRQIQLAYTDVRAPIRGLASRAMVDEHNIVGVGEPTLLTTITRMDPIWVYFDVPERILLEYLSSEERSGPDESNPFPTMEVALADSAEGTYPFKGVMNWADTQVDESTGTIRIRGELPNADRRLFPGLFVRARVPRRELPGALLVPEDAIGSGLDGPYVLVVGAGDVVEQRRVELGSSEGSQRVILNGIGPDDRVIVRGAQKARPGTEVSVVEAAETQAVMADVQESSAVEPASEGG